MAQKSIFQNPIIAEQSKAEVPFVPDRYLGHTMPRNRDFLGESGYISLEDMIQQIKKSRKRAVLNIGDSSTSGWDSNIVTENRARLAKGEALKPAFFRYKTYSDYLREVVGDQFIVINAGVPAHTSLQGRRRLEQLVDRFEIEGIHTDYVTAYYGNNDSVWEENREDKEWVGSSFFGKLKKSFSKRQSGTIVTRTTPQDYQKNMESIVEFCREKGAIPILIEPQTPLYWKPGTRVKNEELPKRNGEGWRLVYSSLDYARELWNKVLSNDYSELKIEILKQARERDYVVPRIKREHLERLQAVARQEDAPLISIDLDRSQDDIRYFIDYCHPIGDANKQIAENIARVIQDYESGQKRPIKNYQAPLGYRILEKTLDFLSYFIKPSGKNTRAEPPTDNYPLF